MRKRIGFVGVIAAATGLLAATTPAIADSSDNDGVNVGNDNNVSVLPIQACGNNVAVLGAVAPVLSPQSNKCTNAPIVDHPSTGDNSNNPNNPNHPAPQVPPKPNHPAPHVPQNPQKPNHPHNPSNPTKPTKPVGPSKPSAPNEQLPTAPQPISQTGHHAVTG